ncbi:MAG: hypothetical protein BV456_10035 [Thermoplasmata archaeon M8B2D]|nr:MAG: hypothetical protein BV456_10035 [Thermoplasmata archaeon M8B2D]
MYRLYQDIDTNEYIITTKPFSIRSYWCNSISQAIYSIQDYCIHHDSIAFSGRLKNNNLQLIVEFDCLDTFYDKYPELFI